MALTRRLFDRRMTLNDLDMLMDRAVGGIPSAAGIDINPDSALTCMAVYAAVRLLSETVGSLPFRLMEQRGTMKEKATNHWLYPLLHDQANPEQTSMEWRETMQAHLLLRGNAYSEKQFDAGGRVIALWPLHP